MQIGKGLITSAATLSLSGIKDIAAGLTKAATLGIESTRRAQAQGLACQLACCASNQSLVGPSTEDAQKNLVEKYALLLQGGKPGTAATARWEVGAGFALLLTELILASDLPSDHCMWLWNGRANPFGGLQAFLEYGDCRDEGP